MTFRHLYEYFLRKLRAKILTNRTLSVPCSRSQLLRLTPVLPLALLLSADPGPATSIAPV